MDLIKPKKAILPHLEKWYPYAVILFLGFSIADLTIISYRHLMLPDQAPPQKPPQMIQENAMTRGAYNTLITRNIFSSLGEIPEALTSKDGPKQDQELPPVPTSLPLKLVGTLVHSNPLKSLAAIEVKGKNQILSFSPKKEIEGMGTVESVERGKVYLRNLSTNRLEYLEMKQDSKVAFGSAKSTSISTGKEVQSLGNNKFAIKRSDLNKYTKDLSSILMQARAVPALKPNGEIYGFRILEMQAESIYTQLGIMPMDVITGVNGSPVTSPAQAMEMYQALQSSNDVKLQVERNGKSETLSYSIQ